MAQFGHKGTAYIITDAIGSTGYLTLQQLAHLHRQGWGLSFHHATPFTQFSSTELIEAVNEGFDFFKENRMSTAMRHLAYPLGKQNRTYVLPLVRQYFNSARLADAGMETLPPGDWSLLRTVNIMQSTSVDEIRKLVLAAKTNHQWLILMFHNIKENPQHNFEYSFSKFREIVKMIAKENIRVLPVHQVWKEFSN